MKNLVKACIIGSTTSLGFATNSALNILNLSYKLPTSEVLMDLLQYEAVHAILYGSLGVAFHYLGNENEINDTPARTKL